MSKSIGLASWEETEFPSICEGCLGDNTNIRMTKEKFGRDCKVCLKPFTIFRWSPGPRMRFRRTEICNTCAKLKNVCQSCLFDLKYGLPVQIRDKMLGINDSVPKNEANREYFLQTNAARISRNDITLLDYNNVEQKDPAATAILSKLAENNKSNHTQRNLAPPCSFYAKGSCTRGEFCPYRHTLVAERYASLQSYRDRFYGENDPTAQKILDDNPHVQLPESKLSQRKIKAEISKGIYIQGIRDGLDAEMIKEYFQDIVSSAPDVTLNEKGDSATVIFRSQKDAELAAQTLGNVDIRGIVVKICLLHS